MKALTVEELETPLDEDALTRIQTGENMTASDQIKMLNAACSHFLEILSNIPEEHRDGVDGDLLIGATQAMLYSIPIEGRSEMWEVLTEAERGGSDGTGEGDSNEEVRDT